MIISKTFHFLSGSKYEIQIFSGAPILSECHLHFYNIHPGKNKKRREKENLCFQVLHIYTTFDTTGNFLHVAFLLDTEAFLFGVS